MARLTEREKNLVACASFITWMQTAFKDANPTLRRSINTFASTYQAVIESYEKELQCLKSAASVDNDTQTASKPVPVDSAVE